MSYGSDASSATGQGEVDIDMYSMENDPSPLVLDVAGI